MTTALEQQTVARFCAEARGHVADVFGRRLGARALSVSVFGSIAADGPIWAGSDVDVILTVDPDGWSTARLCAEVAAATREATDAVRLPLSVTVGTVDDVTLLWSETVRRSLVDNAVTVLGRPLASQILDRQRGWDWTAVRRGALRLLCFTRRHILDQYLDASAHATGLLKSCLNAARFAVWSATAPDQRLVSHPTEVLPRFAELFGDSRYGHVPGTALRHLVDDRPAGPPLLAECVGLADALLSRSRQRYPDLFVDGDIFIDPV